MAEPAGPDERDLIINKLKEDLILARRTEKSILILENHLADLLEKNKIAEDEARRRSSEGKAKNDTSQKMIADLKREVEVMKGELRNNTIELGELEANHLELKKHLTKRANEI